MTAALLLLAFALASGAAGGAVGWKAHAAVDDRRMRRLLARLHDTLDAPEVVAHH